MNRQQIFKLCASLSFQMTLNRKRKGIVAERELLHKFWETGKWIALRAPASGAIKYPCPDLLVGNAERKLAIECKTTAGDKQYLSAEQIGHLTEFARIFAAEPWVAVRFKQTSADKRDWFFLTLEDLEQTNGGNFVITKDIAALKGLSFEEIARTD